MEDNNSQQGLSAMAFQWSGPLPPPDALAKYEATTPGAAERILSMAEREMEQRHRYENEMLRQDDDRLQKRCRLDVLSMWLGFVCVLVLSALIGFAIYKGADSVAIGTAIGAIAAVAGLFTYSKLTKEKERT